MSRRFAAALALAGVAGPAWAQLPPPLPGIIERVAPVEQPRLAPSPMPDAPEAQRGPGEDRVVQLRRVELADATVLTGAALAGTIGPLEGQAVPLRRIEEARIAVLGAFRAAGYPFVAVNANLVPLPDGAFDLRFSVTEARVTEIRLDGDIGPAATLALRFAEPLQAMGPLQGAALERVLLLISDIPGVTVQGVLQPVEGAPGALRLVLRLERRAFSGLATLDNRAFRLTGPLQALLVAQANSFTNLGERTEISLYGTEGPSQRFAQATSEVFVGRSGLRVRVYAGYGESTPRGFLAAIGYRGTSTVAGLAASYPLIRSRPANLTLNAQLDHFQGTVDANRGGASLLGRDSFQAVRLGATGQLLDPIELGPVPLGSNFGAIRLHQGLSGDMTRSARAGARAEFTKLTFDIQRSQPIAELPWGLFLSAQAVVSAQWSADVLPSSEKFLLGGNRITRGYYSGQVAGDSGWAAGVELQLERGTDLPPAWRLPAMRLQTQLYLFHDRGRATQNVATERDVSLSSWGGGVRLFLDRRAQVEAEVVRRLERRPDGANAAALAPVAAYVNLVLRY
ncbi:MAG: BamA/TamA family outer membrane protein [Acetobacteraceae bacterium]|nr:BamA/TamA family outer membrane protein [Acetobacteraceae bacterium]